MLVYQYFTFCERSVQNICRLFSTFCKLTFSSIFLVFIYIKLTINVNFFHSFKFREDGSFEMKIWSFLEIILFPQTTARFATEKGHFSGRCKLGNIIKWLIIRTWRIPCRIALTLNSTKTTVHPVMSQRLKKCWYRERISMNLIVSHKIMQLFGVKLTDVNRQS